MIDSDLILITEQIELINKVNSHNIIIPEKNNGLPEEIKISIHGLPIWSEVYRKARLFECSDINIYANRENITKHVIAELVKLIDQHGNKEDYIRSLDGLLKKQENRGYSNGYISKVEIAKIKTLLKTNPLSHFLRMDFDDYDSEYILGNKTPYHLFNFIYNGVTIPSLVLFSKTDTKYKNLYISSGKNPSIDDDFDRYEQGGVNVQIELYYHNPIEKLLKDVFKRLTRLHKQIEEDRNNYLHPISNNTDVIQKDLHSNFKKIHSDLVTISENIDQIGE